LASAGRQSSVDLLKTAKYAVFHVSDPKKGAKIKISKIPTPLFFKITQR